MSTLVLQAADKVVGGLMGTASSLVGRAVSGLFAGSANGDRVRFTEGPRLTEMQGLSSEEGAPIPRLYGRARIGGQLIWATRFEEVVSTSVTIERASGRRGGKGGSRTPKTTTVASSYSYVANLAIGLCEGPVAFVRRVWADGREVDLTTVTIRVHTGGEDQAPDPLIVAKEGAADAPAYRGLAYVVFERLPLGPFGNRVPQFSFEVVRPAGTLAPAIRSVCLIPGATEFGYDTAPVSRVLGLGRSAPENVHQFQRTSDVLASLDALEALCPNLTHVSVVASWFGTDLRAGECRIEPRVDLAAKATSGGEWSVAGLTRWTAAETSREGGIAAYGGTPSDDGVVRLIRELKARGLAVTLYPFVMMDVPAGNALPDPWSEAAAQPAYPWRGHITCHPAPGRLGSVDGSPEAAAQLAAFFGTAQPGSFAAVGYGVAYSGPAEWSLRRLALHYATLALAAGGVDAFVIGSELVGLTRVRSGPGVYPAVGQLRALAADVRAMLGEATRIVYAADWTEYGAHVLDDGSEVRFPLDPLFADPAIDAVGIDYYPPIADWRDGRDHADGDLTASGSDIDYLRDRLGAGEAFDWFYANADDRDEQVRTPISDGAYGKPWTFRPKDLVGWWSSAHVERVGGVETAATAWVPCSKPIWLTEIGVPAVDQGANAPNVFPDAKSADGGLPPFSAGARDDLLQARALEAILSRFDPALPGFAPPMNPTSPVYGGRMVDPTRTSLWCWDARPYPAFPQFDGVWADGKNWQTGHWLNGRLEGAPLGCVLSAILADHGLPEADKAPHFGFVEGYVIDRPMSARAALEPLVSLFGAHALAGPDGVGWRGGAGEPVTVIATTDLVDEGRGVLLSRGRAQETDLPAAIELGFTDGGDEYARAVVGSRRLVGTSRRELAIDSALVTRTSEAQRLADAKLQALWAGRESVSFALSPRAISLEAGDLVALDGGTVPYRIERIVDGAARRIEARAAAPAGPASAPSGSGGRSRRDPPAVGGPPVAIVLDLPARSEPTEVFQHLAVAADPWPGQVAVYRASREGEFTLHRLVDVPAVIGRTLGIVPPGPVWRWDHGTRVEVELSSGTLASVSEEAALAGANLLALRGADGSVEIVCARSAELIGERRFRLSHFLRGLGGTEHLAGRPLPVGADIVVLDGAVVPLATSLAEIGQTWTYRVGPAMRDVADPAFVSVEATTGDMALRPFAPVQARARRGPDGIALRWIRRTRTDGDAWGLADVPLGEEGEAYEVDVLANGAALRTLPARVPAALYPAVDELADFGAPQTQLALRIRQISRTVGAGRNGVFLVPVR